VDLRDWTGRRLLRQDNATSRADVITAAAQLLATPPIDTSTDAPRIAMVLHAREALSNTAGGDGVAMPHAFLDALDAPRMALLWLSPPVDFGAADGHAVDLVLACLFPERDMSLHLQQLADLAEGLADPLLREQLRAAAGDSDLALSLLATAVTPDLPA